VPRRTGKAWADPSSSPRTSAARRFADVTGAKRLATSPAATTSTRARFRGLQANGLCMPGNATTSAVVPSDAPPALTKVLIPFYLHHWPSIFQFQRCEIVQGIDVRTPSKTDIGNIENSFNPTKHKNDYSPNVIISIERLNTNALNHQNLTCSPFY
jgi:hypothetical protein